jgi:hypothetical protein
MLGFLTNRHNPVPQLQREFLVICFNFEKRKSPANIDFLSFFQKTNQHAYNRNLRIIQFF